MHSTHDDVVNVGPDQLLYLWAEQAPEQREDETGECPRCSGSGYEECICTRWSDNDVGCATCNGSSRMTCRSCGGGGTAVPATAKIIARRREHCDAWQLFTNMLPSKWSQPFRFRWLIDIRLLLAGVAITSDARASTSLKRLLACDIE